LEILREEIVDTSKTKWKKEKDEVDSTLADLTILSKITILAVSLPPPMNSYIKLSEKSLKTPLILLLETYCPEINSDNVTRGQGFKA
jgi:hypothetical protein